MGNNQSGGGTRFGAALKAIREKAGLSQAELAAKADMNVFGIAKLEQGVREPGWATVLKLAAALGVDCTAFAAATEEKPAAKKATPKKGRRRGKK